MPFLWPTILFFCYSLLVRFPNKEMHISYHQTSISPSASPAPPLSSPFPDLIKHTDPGHEDYNNLQKALECLKKVMT